MNMHIILQIHSKLFLGGRKECKKNEYNSKVLYRLISTLDSLTWSYYLSWTYCTVWNLFNQSKAFEAQKIFHRIQGTFNLHQVIDTEHTGRLIYTKVYCVCAIFIRGVLTTLGM